MPRRTAAEAAQTRRDILASARHLFAARGYNHVSVPDIAKAVGVTHGALYHHFANKQDLFRAVFAEIEHELNDGVIAAALAEPTAWDSFVAGTRFVLGATADPTYQQVVLTDAPSVFGWHEWRSVDSAVGMQTMRIGLDMLQADGFLPDVDLDTFAVLLFGAITEGSITLARPDCPTDVDRIVDMVCAVVLALSPAALSRRPGSR